MVLAKAAKFVRSKIFDYQNKFDGSFTSDCQETSVPDVLITLIRMILEGTNIANQSAGRNGRSSIACAISQLISFNSVVKCQGQASSVVRHSEYRETPLPIYLGTMIHAMTRKRDIIDKLYRLGLSISCDRVLQLSTDLANAVIQQYENEGVVCPPSLRKGVFTTSAVDNIDHNPSSTTARDSFHGTAISLTSHLTNSCLGVKRDVIHRIPSIRSKTISSIATSYAMVTPASLAGKNPTVPFIGSYCMPTITAALGIDQKDKQWLIL